MRDAEDLIRLLHGVRAKVNLIPFNAYPGASFGRSPDERIEAFRERLLASGVHATVRISRGRDIQAACGQLAASAANAEPSSGERNASGVTTDGGHRRRREPARVGQSAPAG